MTGRDHILSSSLSKAGFCWRCLVCPFYIVVGSFGFCEPGTAFFPDGYILARPADLESVDECFHRIYPRLVRTACTADDDAKMAALVLLT